MDADHDIRLCLLHQLDAALHILYLFPVGIRIIKPAVLCPGHHGLHVRLLQQNRQPLRDGQIDVLFQRAVHTHLPGIVSSVACVHHYAEFLHFGAVVLFLFRLRALRGAVRHHRGLSPRKKGGGQKDRRPQ